LKKSKFHGKRTKGGKRLQGTVIKGYKKGKNAFKTGGEERKVHRRRAGREEYEGRQGDAGGER